MRRSRVSSDITKGHWRRTCARHGGHKPDPQHVALHRSPARLGHLTIVGLGGDALPVNFNSPPHECSVASPYWGYILELIEVVTLAQTGKIKMLVEHFPLERASEAGRGLNGLREGPGCRTALESSLLTPQHLATYALIRQDFGSTFVLRVKRLLAGAAGEVGRNPTTGKQAVSQVLTKAGGRLAGGVRRA